MKKAVLALTAVLRCHHLHMAQGQEQVQGPCRHQGWMDVPHPPAYMRFRQ
jgi:hypothetical protein